MRLSRQGHKNLEGYLFISPWILGFVIWTAFPMVFSFLMSFTDWHILTSPKWIGLGNYAALPKDDLFGISLLNTVYYVGLSVPLHLIVSLLAALGLNAKLKGIQVYRTLYYIPSITPAVANAILWLWIFNPSFGLANVLLQAVGLKPQMWVFDPALVKLCFVMMSLWAFGQGMIIFLGGLQGIPQMLYEAADIDGAGRTRRFWHITLPLLSPVIFFNLVTGIIGSFQVFTSAYIMTGGGPANASLFYVLYLYRNAFEYFKMGYASTLAWVLFVIVVIFTLAQFKLSSAWVYYEAEFK